MGKKDYWKLPKTAHISSRQDAKLKPQIQLKYQKLMGLHARSAFKNVLCLRTSLRLCAFVYPVGSENRTGAREFLFLFRSNTSSIMFIIQFVIPIPKKKADNIDSRVIELFKDVPQDLRASRKISRGGNLLFMAAKH